VDQTVLQFVKEGADLTADDKAKLQQIACDLASLAEKFKQNALDSTKAWELYVENEAELAGLPESAVTAARVSAEEKGQPGKWRFCLDFTSRSAVLRFADNESLRHAVWEASSRIGTGEFDSEPLIWDILRLRHEKAKLLGFAHFPDYILRDRMVKSGAAALNFVEQLHDRVERRFLQDDEDLKAYIATKTGEVLTEIKPWNRAYWSRALMKELYDLDSEVLRPYFSVDEVLKGLFRIVSTIYGINVVEARTFCGEQVADAIEVYHPDVRVFNVYDNADGRLLGRFFADLYPREQKRSGAWAFQLDFRSGDIPHIAFIGANLQRPVGDKPAFLSHSEVETIFHEFGHLCHFVLDESPYQSLRSGEAVWDFIELPSQFLENWAWERSALDLFAKHSETGEPISDDLFQRMIRAKNFQTGIANMGQLSFGKLDLELHLNYEKYVGRPIDELDRELLVRYRIPSSIKVPSRARELTHLFGGSVAYASAYYSYLWAQVLDADAFTVFQKEGVMNVEYGLKFRKEILAKGHSQPADELFRNFMGRDPDMNAFLVRNDLVD
jgi:oligopeptidase A